MPFELFVPLLFSDLVNFFYCSELSIWVSDFVNFSVFSKISDHCGHQFLITYTIYELVFQPSVFPFVSTLIGFKC